MRTMWMGSYDNPRPDIQAVFPGYANADGAVGVKMLDTTTLADGVHTIAWVVTDSEGAAAGIGSRFFTVANNVGSPSVTTPSPVATLPVAASGIMATRGYEVDAPADFIVPNHQGVHHVEVAAVSRVAIDLNPAHEAATFRGYVRDGDGVRALPIGSHLDARTGEFVSAPGLGFGGTHHLIFVRERGGDALIRVDVTIRPHER